MGDQMASMFGSGCYNNNNLKITIGTGAFLDVNTGDTVHPCLNNMYPMIGWKIRNNLTYMLEIPSINSGSLILWLQRIGKQVTEKNHVGFKVAKLCMTKKIKNFIKKREKENPIGVMFSSFWKKNPNLIY